MPHEQALSVLNTLHEQLASLARAVVDGLADGHMTSWEGIAVTMKAMALASTVMTLVESMPPNIRKDLLYCLEYGTWSVPDA